MEQNEDIKFLNFVPSAEERRCIYVVLGTIRNLSPSNANLTLLIRQIEPQLFRSSCKVVSPNGIFYCDLPADTVQHVIDEVLANIKQQLESWRQRRYAEVFSGDEGFTSTSEENLYEFDFKSKTKILKSA